MIRKNVMIALLWLTNLHLALAQEDVHLVSAGKQVSQVHCARCHVVDPEKPFTGISSTPSFSLMVNELPDWEIRFGSFFARLPHPSIVSFKGEDIDPSVEALHQPVILEPKDIDAIVAYARSLKK